MKISRCSLLLYNSFISVFKLLPFVFKKAKDGKAKLIIRFDDYGVWCNSDWITIEEEVIRLHEKYDVNITFGVVPDSKYPLIAHPLSPSAYPKEYENLEYNPFPLTEGSKRVEVLKESVKKGISEVALHGYSHPKGYSNIINTEFLGLPYDLQYCKLLQGKKRLESLFNCKVSTLIPPHNTYDYLTINLLRDLGFNCISGVRPGLYSPRCNGLNIKYLWFNENALPSFNRRKRNKHHYECEPITILMLHHTNFTKNGVIDKEKLEEYEHFLEFVKEDKIDNYLFSNVPEKEVLIYDTAYLLEKDNVLFRIIRKYWPRVACNYIEYKMKY